MPSFVLIESAGPASGPAVARFIDDAQTLARSGHQVRLVLVQEGVTAARLPAVAQLLCAGGELWVDQYSLTQRGLGADQLPTQTQLVGMGEVADELLAPDTTVVWH